MGIANADQTRLKEDLSKVQQSEWSDQQKADYITDLLREYSDEYELPYLSVMNRPEIRELLEQNEGVAQQVLAELGRLQIEQDIAQRMEASSGLSLAEHQAKWMVIDGKCYTYVMPYYGEIPGYTYMEVRRGPDPAAPDGYLYTVDYIPSSEASRYEFNNGLIVTYEVFSTFYNLVYFSLYLPYLQEQYGQGQVAKTTPKPGDPDFMGPLLLRAGDSNFIGPSLPILGDPNFIGPIGGAGGVNNPEAHSVVNYAKLKEQYRVAELGNDIVDNLTTTGKLPSDYITKSQAKALGWSEGKALNNYAPGKALGGDIFDNTTGVLPSSTSRVWYEVDVGIDYTMSRSNSKNPAYRILYSNDGLIYGTYDHYETVFQIYPN